MISLPNKWRPRSFAEVIGQNTIVSILSKQIATKTFRNAYLFTGPAGCGKTTLARIMASEINNNEGEPIEIDAATNNGVECIRGLVQDSQQSSIDSEYKVYLIDEAHCLTSAAWSSALKLIEEPPVNSIFIFCTTEAQKIPETIMTRVQRFDFKRIKDVDICNRLEFILNEETPGVNFERDALKVIAAKSKGYMREAVSLLEKCLSYSQEITVENVEAVLGIVDHEKLFEFLKAVVEKDATKSLSLINSFKEYKSSSITLLDELLEFFIKAAEVQKTRGLYFTELKEEVKNYILTIEKDLMSCVDRLFRYRLLANKDNADSLINIVTMEICR